ncbi:MAG: IS6 family transposase [Halobacteriales archaeon]|nr:IS6 family transposase [Halobacteriales archaeon]
MDLTPWADSRTPALAIVARGDQIQANTDGSFTVRSQSHPETAYAVTGDSCRCIFHTETGAACIHLLAVRLRAELQRGVLGVEAKRTPPCPQGCGGSVVRDGKRRAKSGTVQTYLCRGCGARFTDREGFQNKRSEPRTIALALDLYFRGLSVRKVADHLAQVHGLKVGHVTVYRWVVHYSRLTAEWMDGQGATTGTRWHMDETVVNVNGAHRYLWNVLDADSRFLLATHVSKNRSLANTRAPIKKAKKVASQRPTEVFTDGMMAYPLAVGKELGRHGPGARNGWVSPHRRVPSIRAAESNNRIERMHGSQKERTKVMRAFDNDRGAATLAEGWRVHYNLVRDHQALGKTPGEAAGLPPLVGFRWLEAIKAASREVEQAKEGASNPAT